jgi:hypothetical protein
MSHQSKNANKRALMKEQSKERQHRRAAERTKKEEAKK